jgi:hypothetical protein
MQALIQALLTSCDNVSSQGQWITSVCATVNAVDVAEAAWKPADEEPSIAEIVGHILAWTEWAVRFLGGQDTEVIDWPPVTTVDPADWEDLRRRLTETLDAFRREIATLSSNALFDVPVPAVTQTNRMLGIQSILVHNAFHAGQITQLHRRYLRHLAGSA